MIAGHATVSMTRDYAVVQLKRQEELTRAIQERLAVALQRVTDIAVVSPPPTPAAPAVPPRLAAVEPVMAVVQEGTVARGI